MNPHLTRTTVYAILENLRIVYTRPADPFERNSTEEQQILAAVRIYPSQPKCACYSTLVTFEGLSAMRVILTALMLTVATQAGAECGNLCERDWWEIATTAEVQAELKAGADIFAFSEDGETALHYAAKKGNPSIIQAILAAGADVTARTLGGADHTPLHYASNAVAVEALLAGGADVTERTEGWNTPLHIATLFVEPVEVIQALLRGGADANARNDDGETPLHNAVRSGSLETAALLLKNGADVTAQTERWPNKNELSYIGPTPLHYAASGAGDPKLIQLLLSAGADLMARTEAGYTGSHVDNQRWTEGGATPLHYAARSGTPNTIHTLLAAGADILAQNDKGLTALHLAAANGNAENILSLLGAGAEAKAKDKFNKTPWDYARENPGLKDTTAYRALNEARFK